MSESVPPFGRGAGVGVSAIVVGRGQLKPERGSTSTSRDSMSNMSETENAVLSGGGWKGGGKQSGKLQPAVSAGSTAAC